MKKLLFIILTLCACQPENENIFNGYIEGEYVYVSPTAGGILDEINITKGSQVKIGDKLFSVDKEIWQTHLASAENEAIAVKEQQSQAEAALVNAEKEYNRSAELLKSNVASQANYDTKFAAYESSKAKVAELKAKAAAAEQTLKQTQKQYMQNIAAAKVNGFVNDVYFRRGEFVNAGTPVVSILPPENVKIRFFVSEKTLPQLKYNQKVFISCDGCQKELTAQISYIAASSEFTPPVIYSNESRNKLVFMAEAVFTDKADNLPVGLPVSIRIK